MNKFHTALSCLALSFWLVSCGSSGANVSDSNVDTVAFAADPVIDESTKIDTDSADTQKPDDLSIPPRRFSTVAEATDFMKNSGHYAQYQSGIIPRMLEENFPYADRLLNNRHNYFIVVDKASMNVILYDKYGNEVKVYRMACGRNFGHKKGKADCRTPEGFFTAQGIYDSTDWLYTDDNGHTSQTRGQFGPRFIRLLTPVTSQVGIHGTGSPRSLGNRVSHGCIRISNESILELVRYARAGMPIIVNPSQRDMAVNRAEHRDVPRITTGRSGPVPSDAAINAEARAIARRDSIAAARAAAAAAADSAKALVADTVAADQSHRIHAETPDSVAGD